MTVQLALNEFLHQHQLSAYRLEVELKGELSRNSIYALAKEGGVKRVDMDTLGKLLDVLSALLNRPVLVQELFKVSQSPSRELKKSQAGIHYTHHRLTNEVLDAHPDILERMREAENL